MSQLNEPTSLSPVMEEPQNDVISELPRSNSSPIETTSTSTTSTSTSAIAILPSLRPRSSSLYLIKPNENNNEDPTNSEIEYEQQPTILPNEKQLSHHSSTHIKSNLQPPTFANMSFCDSCHNEVGTLLPIRRNRHHCRNCGGTFCDNCSMNAITIPYEALLNKGPFRVCDVCYERIKEFYLQTKNSDVTWDGLTPLTAEEFTKQFHDLPSLQTPLVIFSCCFFMDCNPFYGHLYLTSDYLCYKSYKDFQLSLSYENIITIIKPQFYFINALQIIMNDEKKYFFAEFNGLRDLCFLRCDQIINAYKLRKKAGQYHHLDDNQTSLRLQAIERRRSIQSAPTEEEGRTMEVQEKNEEIIEEDEEEELLNETLPLPSPDTALCKMISVLDIELNKSIKDCFLLYWKDCQFYEDFMKETKDIETKISEWKVITKEEQEDPFHCTNQGFRISNEKYIAYREISSQHATNVTFPGLPPYAKCTKLQRYFYEKTTKDIWDRLVISELQRIENIPYSNYFEIEMRWSFLRDGNQFTHVEVGLQLHFIKSTWFKSQIIASTISEVKETMRIWTECAKRIVASPEEIVKSPPSIRMKRKEEGITVLLPKKINSIRASSSEYSFYYLLLFLIGGLVMYVYLKLTMTIEQLEKLNQKLEIMLRERFDTCHKDTMEGAIESIKQYLWNRLRNE